MNKVYLYKKQEKYKLNGCDMREDRYFCCQVLLLIAMVVIIAALVLLSM